MKKRIPIELVCRIVIKINIPYFSNISDATFRSQYKYCIKSGGFTTAFEHLIYKNFYYHTFDLVYQKSVLFQIFHFHWLDNNINLYIRKQYLAIAIESSFKLFGVVGVGIILSFYYKKLIIKFLNDKISSKEVCNSFHI